MSSYIKEQIQEATIKHCINVIKVGCSLDQVLEAFNELDADVVRDLFTHFTPNNADRNGSLDSSKD